jgi:hypothetical protein
MNTLPAKAQQSACCGQGRVRRTVLAWIFMYLKIDSSSPHMYLRTEAARYSFALLRNLSAWQRTHGS